MTRLPLPNGLVRATLADAMGRVVDEVTAENAFLSQYAAYFAKALAGNLGAITLPISHLAVAPAGVTIETFEAIAGWTGTPTLDTSSYRQGLASFSRAATASTQAVLTSPTVALDLATGFSTADAIEIAVKVDLRGRLDTAQEAIRLQTSTGNYYAATWALLESYLGQSLVDGTWTLIKVPKAAFTATGAPSWASITQLRFTAAANAGGTVTCWFDDARLVPVTLPVGASETALQNEISKIAVVSLTDLGGGQVRAKAFWSTSQIVGTHRLLGLYGNGGATLMAIVALPGPLSKTNLLSLTVEWTVTTSGA